MPHLSGKSLGQYQIIEPIGSGGMAQIPAKQLPCGTRQHGTSGYARERCAGGIDRPLCRLKFHCDLQRHRAWGIWTIDHEVGKMTF